MKDADHGQCLTDETLTEYLEGALDPVVKAASEVHLVACEHCRGQLAFFMKVLRDDVTEEESGELKVIAAEWDRRKSVDRPPQRRLTLPGMLAAVAAVAAVLIVVAVSTWDRGPQSGNQVVQLLLENNRPFEARMTGQPYHPLFLPT